MGHHMYWAKWMTENGQLPTYEGLPDFIIGEHIIFGLFHLLGNLDFFGAFPVLLLLFFNLFSLLAIFILTLRIFSEKKIAILVLFFLGVLYAVSSPQAKFVSGGVIGNILGNFLTPLAFYFYCRAFKFWESPATEKYSKIFLALAFFLTFGLFYTHHLTAFVFLFVSLFLMILFALGNSSDILPLVKKTFSLIFSLPALLTFFLGLIFFFGVFTPTYVQPDAVATAVGTPEKSTRVGLSLLNIESSVGAPRLALGFLGLLLLFFQYKRKNFGYALLAAWAIMLFLLSTRPDWLFVDLPSNRIGNYLTYPLSILSAYAFFAVFKNSQNALGNLLLKSAFISIACGCFGARGGKLLPVNWRYCWQSDAN
jgi:hypothetical protein